MKIIKSYYYVKKFSLNVELNINYFKDLLEGKK